MVSQPVNVTVMGSAGCKCLALPALGDGTPSESDDASEWPDPGGLVDGVSACLRSSCSSVKVLSVFDARVAEGFLGTTQQVHVVVVSVVFQVGQDASILTAPIRPDRHHHGLRNSTVP